MSNGGKNQNKQKGPSRENSEYRLLLRSIDEEKVGNTWRRMEVKAGFFNGWLIVELHCTW